MVKQLILETMRNVDIRTVDPRNSVRHTRCKYKSQLTVC